MTEHLAPQAPAPAPAPAPQRRALQVRTYRGRAIAALVLSALVGIFALSQSLKVDQRLRAGDVEGARRASHATRTLSTVAFCLFGVGLTWTVISVVVGAP